MGAPSGPPRIFWRLFIIAAAFDLGKAIFVAFWEKFVITPSFLSSSAPNLEIATLQFGSTLGGFLISPVLVFVAFYALGPGIKLNENWRPAILSLFVGGMVGGALTLFSEWLIILGADPSSFGNFLNSIFGTLTGLGLFVLGAVSEGLSSVFIGVTALFLRSRRVQVAGLPPATTATEGPQS